MNRLTVSYFERDPVTCARELIGCGFHWMGCVGRIVETEAYAAEGDEACHTWFRPSTREFVASHSAGDAYVYLNYGVHWMFNVLVKGRGGDGFVLFRALEPVTGQQRMKARRSVVKEHLLAAGPGRLTKALGIAGMHHGMSFLAKPGCGITPGHAASLVTGPRIGITRAVDLPWRFGEAASKSLSRSF